MKLEANGGSTPPNAPGVAGAMRRAGRRKGQAAVLASLSLTVMFALLGLAVDVGTGKFKRQSAQAAADSAAMAAAIYAANNYPSWTNYSTCASGVTCNAVTSCTYPTSPSVPFDAGCLYAKANGYTNQTTGYPTVTMLANNTSSPVSGNNPQLWFQATVTDSMFTLFGRFGAVPSMTISARGVAGVVSTGGADCVLALETSGTGITDTAGGNVIATNCNVYSNSSISHSGGGSLSARKVYYNGSYTGGASSPVAINANATVANPFANVVAPTVPTTCDHTGYNPGAGPLTLSPGEYCGGLTLNNSHLITFSPGLYIINGTNAGGNSFDSSGGGGITGTGVTIFITGKNGYSAGPVHDSAGGAATLWAPSTGAYRGLLFYQDPSVTYATTNSITAGGSSTLTGTLYFPTTSLTFTGGGASASTALVANTITFTGGGASGFTADTTGQYTGLVTHIPSLIQ